MHCPSSEQGSRITLLPLASSSQTLVEARSGLWKRATSTIISASSSGGPNDRRFRRRRRRPPPQSGPFSQRERAKSSTQFCRASCADRCLLLVASAPAPELECALANKILTRTRALAAARRRPHTAQSTHTAVAGSGATRANQRQEFQVIIRDRGSGNTSE